MININLPVELKHHITENVFRIPSKAKLLIVLLNYILKLRASADCDSLNCSLFNLCPALIIWTVQ